MLQLARQKKAGKIAEIKPLHPGSAEANRISSAHVLRMGEDDIRRAAEFSKAEIDALVISRESQQDRTDSYGESDICPIV